ncbi:hypothetical protein RHMOL_Rhmol12G0040900 [Rhododendron molle]|uniref:Uncharacterized protein n=1 Tax=Rhododendron molle TaxID=49168 RepID=A0ACC0LEG9_RHOML|nr:hypothetical protein RHMOL_Rhmol12G0040900 [Rhododendron molle]
MNSMRSIFSLPSVALRSPSFELQQWRGIRVKVRNGNLEQALVFMQRKMQSSGIERMIKLEQTHHIKNSEKRVLARKNLERKIRSQELARKLKSILIKKVSYVQGTTALIRVIGSWTKTGKLWKKKKKERGIILMNSDWITLGERFVPFLRS